MNILQHRVRQSAQGAIDATQEHESPLQAGVIVKQYDAYCFDVQVRGRIHERVGVCLPFDRIYASLVGQSVWVYFGAEPVVLGVQYPVGGGAYEAGKKLRRVHALVI
jgi:hypothetical protein